MQVSLIENCNVHSRIRAETLIDIFLFHEKYRIAYVTDYMIQTRRYYVNWHFPYWVYML